MNTTSACPDASVFEQLAHGTLSPEDSEVVARHLEQCASCGERFGAWGCDWLRALQGSAGRDVAITPPVEAMMQRLEKWAVGRVETPTTAGDASEETSDPTSMLQPARGGGEIGWLGIYRVLKVLGRGGMGVVFLAEDSVLKRPVALKVLRGALAERPSARQRFLREAQAAAAIRHEHVVTIFQAGEQAGVGYLAMELLQGESLEARLERENRIPISTAVDLGRQIAQGLAAAHELSLIHRDLKPANIFLVSDGVVSGGLVKLLDFGLARAAADEAKLTKSGTVVGTPAYMAPEQAEGKPVDARSDLFSLGCVLYRMVVGVRPFRGDSTLQILRALAVEQPAPPQQLNPECPAALSELIMRLLSKDPAGRPASATAVAEQLDRIAEAALSRRRRQPRPSRWMRAAAVVGLLGVLAVAVVIMILPEKEKGTGNGPVVNSNGKPPTVKGSELTVTPALDLLREAVLLMTFEKDTFYKKGNLTYVRDLSGRGNDGVCENVEFNADGKVGGGLMCRMAASLRLAKSLINRQPNYTITAWVRPIKTKGMTQRIYQLGDHLKPYAPAFAIEIQPNFAVRIAAFNQHRKPDPWDYGGFAGEGLRPDVWHFLAVVLYNGDVGKGHLQITIDNLDTGVGLQMVDAPDPVVDLVGHNLRGDLDEVAVFPRALTGPEVELIRQLGKDGKTLCR
ncbi:MAG: protein kinase [Gemmataceae bacterium]|nr:protein kinase [Gemmataceae bacterium]